MEIYEDNDEEEESNMENQNVDRVNAMIDDLRVRTACLETRLSNGVTDKLGCSVYEYIQAVIDGLVYLRDTYGSETSN